jgi:uncharacterized protein
MNVTHPLQGILFEWDENKAIANFKKHGVAFTIACETFFDPFLLPLDEESEMVDDELREKVIGMTVRWQLMCIVYVMREDRIRLISARSATNAERKSYENQ